MIARASTVGQLVNALLKYPLSTPIGDVQVLDGRASSSDPMRLSIAGDVDPEAAVREALIDLRKLISSMHWAPEHEGVVGCIVDDITERAKPEHVADILDAVRQRT